jgi:hypothetical protein
MEASQERGVLRMSEGSNDLNGFEFILKLCGCLN